MKNKEEELNKAIAELKQNIALLQNKLAEQESLKLVNSHLNNSAILCKFICFSPFFLVYTFNLQC